MYNHYNQVCINQIYNPHFLYCCPGLEVLKNINYVRPRKTSDVKPIPMVAIIYVDEPVASFGIRNRKAIGMKLHKAWTMMPMRRLSNDPESMFNIDANPAPIKDPNVDPKLFIDMKRANKVPSIPGGHSCPDKIRKGINLHFFQKKK